MTIVLVPSSPNNVQPLLSHYLYSFGNSFVAEVFTVPGFSVNAAGYARDHEKLYTRPRANLIRALLAITRVGSAT